MNTANESQPQPQEPRLPSEKIRLIHSRLVQHISQKDVEQLNRAKLLPDCPAELLGMNVTLELAIERRMQDPHTLIAAVLRFLDEMYMVSVNAANRIPN